MKNLLQFVLGVSLLGSCRKRKGMASIKFGGGIVAMAGKIAGTVFARNRSGAYARAWAKPVNPKTDRQDAARGRIGMLGAIWGETLTAEQRQGWAQYASNVTMTNRLGESMHLSGFNQFCRTNGAALSGDVPYIADAPAIFALAEQDPDIVATITAAGNQLSLAFDTGQEWPDEDDAHMLVHVGHPVNGNIEFFGGPFRYTGKIDGDAATAPTSPQVFTIPYQVEVGQKVFVRCRILRADGRLSEFFRCSGVAG